MRCNDTVCVGHSSIEGLVQMSPFLTSYLKELNVDEVEASFLAYLKHKDPQKLLENATAADIDLHINFADFVHVCSELNPEINGMLQPQAQQQAIQVQHQQVVPLPQQQQTQPQVNDEVNDDEPPTKKTKTDKKNAPKNSEFNVLMIKIKKAN